MGTCSNKENSKLDKYYNTKGNKLSNDESVIFEFVSKNKADINTKKTITLTAGDLIQPQTRRITELYSFLPKVLHKCFLAEIRLAENIDSGVKRVIKIINKENLTLLEKKQVLREINALKQLDHPNIVRLYELIESKHYYNIVREYIEGLDLMTEISVRLEDLTELVVANIIKGLLSAVAYLHCNDIVHGKIHVSKVIISNQEPVLVGFGTVRTSKTNNANTDLRDLGYIMAPEAINGSFTHKSDVWACGIVLYELLTGLKPYKIIDGEIIDAIQNRQFTKQIENIDNISDNARDLLKKMLTHDPYYRPLAEELLNENWFKHQTNKNKEDIVLRRVVIAAKDLAFKSKLQEALFSYIVNKTLAEKHKEKIYAQFKLLDKNGDGTISKNELLNNIEHLSYNVSKKEIDDAFDAIDKNNDNCVTFSEFANAMINRQELLYVKNVLSVFRKFDKNNNGRLAIDDFRYVFENMAELPKEEIAKYLDSVDIDGDGLVSFNELSECIEKLINPSS